MLRSTAFSKLFWTAVRVAVSGSSDDVVPAATAFCNTSMTANAALCC